MHTIKIGPAIFPATAFLPKANRHPARHRECVRAEDWRPDEYAAGLKPRRRNPAKPLRYVHVSAVPVPVKLKDGTEAVMIPRGRTFNVGANQTKRANRRESVLARVEARSVRVLP